MQYVLGTATMPNAKLVKRVLLVLTFGLILVPSTLLFAQDLARGYATKDSGLKPGMVVALSGGTADKPEVTRADDENASKIIGVTVTSEESLVTIASGADQVYVQSSGEVSVYATDINGIIKKGDAVTTSSLRGSVMRANSNSAQVGLALEDFPQETEETAVDGVNSTTQVVRVAKIKITLANGLSERGNIPQESSLERLGRAITGKKVGELQVIIALLIFIIVMVAEGSIIYGAVSSAITAIGRNPLAKKVIVRELARVFVMVTIVFAIGMGAIYLVLNV